MKRASGTLLVAAVLCAVAAAGCQKKLDLTFVNHTGSVLPVKVTTPDAGTMQAGSVGPSGSRLRYSVRIRTEDLPATCTCTVGVASKTFTVTEDTKQKLWFHYTEKGLAGPMDKDTPFVDVTKERDIKVVVPGGTVIE